MANPRQDDRTHQSAQAAQQAAQDAVRRTGDEFRKTAEDTTRRATGTAADLSRSALDAGERATRSGTEIVQHNAELMRKAWHSYIDMMAQMTGRSADELGRAFPNANPMTGEDARKSAEQSTRNVDAVLDSGTVLAKGIENVTREWVDFARGRVEQNLASFSQFTKCRSPQHVAALQSEMMRDNMEGLLQISRKVAEISVRVAEDAMGKVTDAAEKAKQAA
ncbi:phasin family protein [Xanthobacteraceae bacterium Astr-EGSB]|uniref:phasin family protein n=1 Tax=Astrobacterium formosum TaxID=3069710 RepID=UPI0027B0150D|nr:phasin family protein [Xanthobacteraceae bacterium Astr-EGSB]